MKDDSFYIHLCEKIGKRAEAKGNPPVGAVIVRNDKIVAEAEEAGRSKNDVTCHAEIEAIRIAVKELQSSDLSECTLYSSHEPCIMCSYAIRFYKISKVVFLHPVRYMGGVTSSMPLLRSDDVPPYWAKHPEIVRLLLPDD